MTDLAEFEQLVRSRRAVRHFRPDPLPEGILDRLLDAARWAPSGYNLQPTHFVTVTDAARKQALFPACMSQQQILEAPATIVFCGDRRVAANNFETVLRLERENGSISPEYDAKLRQMVPLAFGRGPVGLGWLWKATLLPLVRVFAPVPSVPAVRTDYWLAKQVCLSAMNFMLGASAAGLATVPMEGFDEARVRRALRIPRHIAVILVVPVGYATDARLDKTRLPLQVHRDVW